MESFKDEVCFYSVACKFIKFLGFLFCLSLWIVTLCGFISKAKCPLEEIEDFRTERENQYILELLPLLDQQRKYAADYRDWLEAGGYDPYEDVYNNPNIDVWDNPTYDRDVDCMDRRDRHSGMDRMDK